MKKIFLLLSTAFLFIVACDKVEPFEDGTYKTKPDVEIGGDSIASVILFEFTGWDCVNCPNAHEKIKELEENYSEIIHSIGIHAGNFADPGDFGPDFRCEVSNALYELMNPDGFPIGSVNSMNGADLKGSGYWSTFINVAHKESRDNPEVFITIEESNTDSTITAKVNVEFAKSLSGNYNLSVYVVENGIEAPQNKNGTIINNYIHSHVLRASMHNGIVGELVGENPTNGTKFECKYTLNVDSEWVADSLHLIPFVYNTETNIVIPTKIVKPKTE